jgi:hypothetical protein
MLRLVLMDWGMDHIWISHRATSHEMDENELRYVDHGAKKFQEKP